MISRIALAFALIYCGSVVAIPYDGCTTAAVNPSIKFLPEYVCFENVLHSGEILFAYDKEIQRSTGIATKKSTGAAMTDFPHLIPNGSFKWVLQPKNITEKTVYIYNEEQQGYLNSYGSRDPERRYVFVGNDRRDVWKFHEHPSIEGAFALENVPTGEFMYAILGNKDPSHPHYFYGQTTRTVYSWNFKTFYELHEDESSYWLLKDCSQIYTKKHP